MMKVCFLVPDGVGIRNYLFSPIIKYLIKSNASISIWHRLDHQVISNIEALHKTKFESIPLVYHREPLLGRFFKEAATYSRLVRNASLDSNPATLLDWKISDKQLNRRILLSTAGLIGKVFKNPNGILKSESFYYQSLKKTDQYRLALSTLKKIKPDLLFCTHQRSPEAAMVVEAAKELDIPTVSVIYSWDNLPKARLVVKSDQYIVWSDYMKSEMKKYYPEIDSNRVLNLGTPQFDFHFDSDQLQSREDFAREHNLDPSKKWICFSGDDEMTSPYDQLYLRDIAETTFQFEDLELIFRPVPVSKYDRYKEVISQYSHIKVIPPKWKRSDSWAYSYPLFEDVSMLSSIAAHCNLVMNIGSTMALDFACFDKPGFYLNYLPEGGDSKVWVPSMIYNRQHFRTMENKDAVVWVNAKSEIATLIEKVIQNPRSVAKQRQEWLNLVSGSKEKEKSSKLIADFILKKD